MNNTIYIPTHCPHCDYELEIINDTHLHCPNEDCDGKKLFNFINGMNAFELDGVGDAFLTELYNSKLLKYQLTPLSVLAIAQTTPQVFENAGMKKGKILDNFINELKKINKLTIEQIIATFSFDGMSLGGKTIKEIAKKFSGVDYSFTGLEKKVVDGFEEGEEKWVKINNVCTSLKCSGIEIEMIKPRSGNFIKLCLTGSPKSFGFSSKGEFISALKEKNIDIEEVSIKDAQILVTDDLNSTSSKMKTAQKLNKPIITYDINNLITCIENGI